MPYLVAIILALIFVPAGCYFQPKYNIYSQEMSGKAKYQEAESSRQIATLEAKAKLESAQMLADAEVVRATGVAKANAIIGNSLKDNEGYLRWLWIEKLDNTQGQVIYIPTEANMPILEAGKRN